MTTLSDFVERLRSRRELIEGEAFCGPPADMVAIAEAHRSVSLTPQHAALLSEIDGAGFNNFILFGASEVAEFHSLQPGGFEEVPGTVWLGTEDSAPVWFFIDSEGHLGRGKGAVYSCPADARTPENCILWGLTLADALLALLTFGWWDHVPESIGELGRRQVEASLSDSNGRWSGAAAGRSVPELLGDEARCGCLSLPWALRGVLGVSDGLSIRPFVQRRRA